MECKSPTQKGESLSFAAKHEEQEDIVLSEMHHSPNDKDHTYPVEMF